MGGIGIWQLVIIAVIVLLLFGSKKLRGLGGDLGAALRGFKKEMHDDKEKDKESDPQNVEHKQVDAEFREDESRKKPEHDHSKRD